MDKVDVLDKGYVRYVEHMGGDLAVVNAARASYLKEHDEIKVPDDVNLIRYLARKNELSPLRHAFFTAEVKAPLMVARQWWKYVVGSDHTMDGWNEASRRYITMEPEFYIPSASHWRSAPANRKQGSGEPVSQNVGEDFTAALTGIIEDSVYEYEAALKVGIAPEQARLLLPAYAMYTVWRWSGSLQSLTHFLQERLASGAQHEITEYAKAVYQLFQPHFPITFEALIKENQDGHA